MSTLFERYGILRKLHVNTNFGRCSIFACFITTLAGIYAIYDNGKSYNNHFSTISSAMQSPGVASLFASRPASARNLQHKIAKTKILLQKVGGVERFRTETDYVALDVV
jgi:hypothetical protein